MVYMLLDAFALCIYIVFIVNLHKISCKLQKGKIKEKMNTTTLPKKRIKATMDTKKRYHRFRLSY